MDPNALATQISQLDSSYNPTQLYNDTMTKLGIPDARTRVQNLQTQLINSENALKQVDPSVTGRTSNSLVTEAQRQRLVNMERQPLAETYNTENQQYGTEQSNLNNLLGQANQQTSLAESDYKNKRDSLATQLDFAQKQQAAAQAKAEADRQFAESQRQFNISSAQKGSKAGSSKAAAATPTSTQRASDKGFNFTDASGNAISARLYAQLTGTNFNTVLKAMAAAGDKGAQDVLKNGGSSKYYKALTWN